MNGAQYIVKFLENKGVDVVFGYPGGAVIPFYDVLGRSSLQHILTRHEQGAVHAADGYARATGKPGVCIATSGPGATNLVTGIANAYLDSVPLLAITGQVGLDSIGRDAFQEADITGITMPITKHSYLVKDIKHLPPILEEAWNVATSGRKGPVLIDVPKDIFVSSVDLTKAYPGITTRKGYHKNGLDNQLPKIVAALEKAKKPLILAGGGVIASQAWDQLLQLVRYTNIPVVTTFMGKGALPENHPASLGIVGMHGLPAANLALSECDVLLAVGTRFSDRVTGKPQNFIPHAQIIHVDIDPAELCKNVRTDIPVVCDAQKFLVHLLKVLKESNIRFQTEDWWNEIKHWQKKYPMKYEKYPDLKPQHVVEEVAKCAGDKVVVVTDVGQHQWFVAQYYPVGGKRSFISSGGLGTMGFGLPAAIGASLGRPGEMVVLFTGDGSFQMNIQELATLVQLQLPVKIFILNNACLGMVRQWQELFFNCHYAHSLFTYNPDFVRLAEAYGIRAYKITEPQEVTGVVAQVLRIPGPVIVECMVDTGENVFPMVPPGGKPNEMLGRWQDEAHISRIS